MYYKSSYLCVCVVCHCQPAQIPGGANHSGSVCFNNYAVFLLEGDIGNGPGLKITLAKHFLWENSTSPVLQTIRVKVDAINGAPGVLCPVCGSKRKR